MRVHAANLADANACGIAEQVVIERRFRRAPDSANGGYACRCARGARRAGPGRRGHTARPAPLDTRAPRGIGRWTARLLDGRDAGRRGRPAGDPDVEPPAGVTLELAEAAPAGAPRCSTTIRIRPASSAGPSGPRTACWSPVDRSRAMTRSRRHGEASRCRTGAVDPGAALVGARLPRGDRGHAPARDRAVGARQADRQAAGAVRAGAGLRRDRMADRARGPQVRGRLPRSWTPAASDALRPRDLRSSSRARPDGDKVLMPVRRRGSPLRRPPGVPPPLRGRGRGKADPLPARLPAVLVPLAPPARRPRRGPRRLRARHARLQPLLQARRRSRPTGCGTCSPTSAGWSSELGDRTLHPRRARLGRDRFLGVRPQAPGAARAPGDHRRPPPFTWNRDLRESPKQREAVNYMVELSKPSPGPEEMLAANDFAAMDDLLPDRRARARSSATRSAPPTTRPGLSRARCVAGSTTTAPPAWGIRWPPAGSRRSTRRRSPRSRRGPDARDLGQEDACCCRPDPGARASGCRTPGRDRPGRRALGALRGPTRSTA